MDDEVVYMKHFWFHEVPMFLFIRWPFSFRFHCSCIVTNENISPVTILHFGVFKSPESTPCRV